MHQKVLSSKEIALSILAGGSTFLALWLWNRAVPVIIVGEFENYGSLAGTVASLLAAAILFSLAAVFVEKQKLLYLGLVAGISAPFLFITASMGTLVVLLVSILLVILAAHRIKKEYALSLGFNLAKLLGAGLPLYFTVVSLIVAHFYFSQLDEEKAVSALLPRSTMSFLLNRLGGSTTIGIMRSSAGLPRIRADETVDEMLVDLIKQQAASQGVSIKELSVREVTQAVAAQRQEIERAYGIKVQGKEKVSDVFYNAVNERMVELLGPYKTYLPYASAAAFFFAFKALTLPVYYVVLLLVFLIIKGLTRANILKLEKKQIEIEKLSLT